MVNMMTYDLERARAVENLAAQVKDAPREVKDLIGYLRIVAPPRISAANYTNPAKQEHVTASVDVRESIGSAERSMGSAVVLQRPGHPGNKGAWDHRVLLGGGYVCAC